ncbi:MAG: hypothetical protein PHF56_12390 [Desulfuromonadaceae bacterium]|nr:hypothetical protein [Desulfuromonadaceae bacterium]
MPRSGCCRKKTNRRQKLQRLGLKMLATIGYLAICLAVGASIHWYTNRPVEQVQYSMPIVQAEDDDFRLLVEIEEESENDEAVEFCQITI